MTTNEFADAVLILHAGIVIFVVGGALYVWIGVWRNWPGVRSPPFRWIHLAIMIYVAALAAIGSTCPLTSLEDALRGKDSGTGFIARWVGGFLYYDLPGWFFTTIYVALAGALIISLVLIRPGEAGKRKLQTGNPSDKNCS